MGNREQGAMEGGEMKGGEMIGDRVKSLISGVHKDHKFRTHYNDLFSCFAPFAAFKFLVLYLTSTFIRSLKT
nr:hypothetical protein Iba_chr08cCG1270 [Ipomoea batatas]GME04338.1 hypothetical protein Iba_scaffold1866CG0630 [Ipomoea batatas]